MIFLSIKDIKNRRFIYETFKLKKNSPITLKFFFILKCNGVIFVIYIMSKYDHSGSYI